MGHLHCWDKGVDLKAVRQYRCVGRDNGNSRFEPRLGPFVFGTSESSRRRLTSDDFDFRFHQLLDCVSDSDCIEIVRNASAVAENLLCPQNEKHTIARVSPQKRKFPLSIGTGRPLSL